MTGTAGNSPAALPLRDLAGFYRDHLERQVLPFWLRHGIDDEQGGFFTCFDNLGERLVSTDKYTWSQGRMLWLLARSVDMARRGLIDLDVDRCRVALREGVRFVSEHLVNGEPAAGGTGAACVYVADRGGTSKEPWPGSGYAVSIFADCFVALGLAEAARVNGDDRALDRAASLMVGIEARTRRGAAPTEPYPVPEAFSAWNVPMITLNAAQETARALEAAGDPRAGEARRQARESGGFLTARMRAAPPVPPDLLPVDEAQRDTLLARHRTPGHVVEAGWFVLREACDGGGPAWVEPACRAITGALELGWDDDYGGLLRYVDVGGGQPRGRPTDARYENLVRDTWDAKLWWPHAEALYATALGAARCPTPELAEELRAWHERVRRYAFATFPHGEGWEWVQNRDRAGKPIDAVVALPVKDPFHLARALLLLVELLQEVGE